MPTPEELNHLGRDHLPGHLGIVIISAEEGRISAELQTKPALMAPNGFLHAGTVVTLADTCCGYGCISSLPKGARGFTTIELKSNHIGTTREGSITCTATMFHNGRTTQVWDAQVNDKDSGKVIALFRCTQLLLYAGEAG